MNPLIDAVRKQPEIQHRAPGEVIAELAVEESQAFEVIVADE